MSDAHEQCTQRQFAYAQLSTPGTTSQLILLVCMMRGSKERVGGFHYKRLLMPVDPDDSDIESAIEQYFELLAVSNWRG